MVEGGPSPDALSPRPVTVPPPSLSPRPGVPGKRGLTVIVAVVVVLVFLFAMVLVGAFGGKGGGGGGARAVPFSTARAEANQVLLGHGAWNLFLVEGFDPANLTVEPLNLTPVKNCTTTVLSGPLPKSLTIPAFQGNLSRGVATEWILGYLQPSTHAEVVVVQTNGAVEFAIEESGPNCPEGNTMFGGIPSDVEDSPSAAAVVVSAGAGAFLAAHPKGVSLVMTMFSFVGQGNVSNPQWTFAYATCQILFGGGTQPAGQSFYASVNATTGQVVPGSVANGTCGTSPPPTNSIGSAIVPGPVTLGVGAGTGGTIASQGCTSGDYCYSVPIQVASENVTPGDFELQVTNESQQFPVVGYAITTAGGHVVVFDTGAVETAWAPGTGNSNTLLSSGMSIEVDMGTAYPITGSWFLVLIGTGSFGGSSLGISL